MALGSMRGKPPFLQRLGVGVIDTIGLVLPKTYHASIVDVGEGGHFALTDARCWSVTRKS